MEIVRRVVIPATIDAVFALVDDLGAYPQWMDLVHDVNEVTATTRRAWDVELRGRVGPLARSKRLRMERAMYEPRRRVAFERAESDGRAHASWELVADLAEVAAGVELTMTLRYGGSLWTGAVMQRVLDEHIERGAEALRDLAIQRS